MLPPTRISLQASASAEHVFLPAKRLKDAFEGGCACALGSRNVQGRSLLVLAEALEAARVRAVLATRPARLERRAARIIAAGSSLRAARRRHARLALCGPSETAALVARLVGYPVVINSNELAARGEKRRADAEHDSTDRMTPTTRHRTVRRYQSAAKWSRREGATGRRGPSTLPLEARAGIGDPFRSFRRPGR